MYSVQLKDAKVLDLKGRRVNLFIDANGVVSDNMSVGLTEVPANTAMDPHTHEDKEEIIFVIEGSGTSIVGGSKEEMKPYTAVLFPIGVEHQVINDTNEPLKFVFMFNPKNDFKGAK